MSEHHTIQCTFSFKINHEKRQIMFEGSTDSIGGPASEVEVEAASCVKRHMVEALREICASFGWRTDYNLVERDGVNNERNKRT